MSLIETRSGGNATGLPPTLSPGRLSRRAAMFGAVTVAGLSVAAFSPDKGYTAPLVIVSPVSADADLIAFAHRIIALAKRCDAAAARQSALEDRATVLCPEPRPLPAPNLSTLIVDTTTSSDGRTLAITVSDPSGYTEAQAVWEKARAAALAVHHDRKRVVEARLGLPELSRRHIRMWSRLKRWVDTLSEMKAATPAGAGAKAAALLVVCGDGQGWIDDNSLSLRTHLLVSLLRDTVRLGAGGRA